MTFIPQPRRLSSGRPYPIPLSTMSPFLSPVGEAQSRSSWKCWCIGGRDVRWGWMGSLTGGSTHFHSVRPGSLELTWPPVSLPGALPLLSAGPQLGTGPEDSSLGHKLRGLQKLRGQVQSYFKAILKSRNSCKSHDKSNHNNANEDQSGALPCRALVSRGRKQSAQHPSSGS